MAVQSTWSLRLFNGEILIYNLSKFGKIRTVFQKLLKVQVGSVIYTDYFTVSKMKNNLKFEVRAYIKGRVGLKVSASQAYS